MAECVEFRRLWLRDNELMKARINTEQDLLALLAQGGCKIRHDPSTAARPKIVESPPPSPETIKTLAAAMSEDELQTSVIKHAHFYGYRVAHFRSVRVTRKDGSTFWQTPVQADGEGFPDLILLKDGQRGLAWELKSEDGPVAKAQTNWLTAFKLAGFDARVVRPSDWLSGLVDSLLAHGLAGFP
jgi:hypothetical protein